MGLDCQAVCEADALSAEPVPVRCYVCYENVDLDSCVNLGCGCAGNLCSTCWSKWCDAHRRGVHPGGCPLCREGAAPAPMLVHAHLLLERLLQHSAVLLRLPRNQLRPWIEACVIGFLADMQERSIPERMNRKDISRAVYVTSSTVKIVVPCHPRFVLEFTRPLTVLLRTRKLHSRGEREVVEAEAEEGEGEAAGASAGAASGIEQVAAALEESRFPRPFIAFGEIFEDLREYFYGY